jgi:hypothetical protein
MKAGSVRPTTTKFVLDNLVRNSYYFFRITAENIIGQSEPLENEQAIQAKPAYSMLKKIQIFLKIFLNK